MSRVTENLSRYVKEKGYLLTVMSEKTGVPYNSLYDSLSPKGRNRDLRDWELVEICAFLGFNPMDFRDKQGKEKAMNKEHINLIKRVLREEYGIQEDPVITEAVPGDEGRYRVELSDDKPWIWDSVRKTFVD